MEVNMNRKSATCFSTRSVMKKTFLLVLGVMVIGSIIGCAGSVGKKSTVDKAGNSSTANAPSKNSTADYKGKTLVVYFSMPETDKPGNMTKEENNSTTVMNGKVMGNVEYFASVIQKNTGADVFRIEPKVPYTKEHKALVAQAKQELLKSARPEIKGRIENLDSYDTIFFGYPNWWGDMPMILYTFLDQYDLSGKTIVPFNVHGGSGFSDTIQEIARKEQGANVKSDGLSISRDDIQDSESTIVNWLKKLGYVK